MSANPHDEMYWPGLGDNRLGLRAVWSVPLIYALPPSENIAEWESYLRSEMVAAASDAFSAHNPGYNWTVDITQIGPAAQDYHGIFLWLEELPKEVLTDLVTFGIERSLLAAIQVIRGRLSRIQRSTGERVLIVDLDLHPNVLVETCKEYLTRFYSAQNLTHSTYELIPEDQQQNGKSDRRSPQQYRISILSEQESNSFLMDTSGRLLEHLGDGKTMPVHQMFPGNVPQDIGPNPGHEKNPFPSQDNIDRSDYISVVAILSADYGGDTPSEWDWDLVHRSGEISGHVSEQLSEAVNIAVSQVLSPDIAEGLQVQNYRVGPAAGGLVGIEHYIVDLFQSRDALPAIISNLSEAWAIYEITSRTYRGLKNWIAKYNDPRLGIVLSYPPAVLMALCESHVRRRYHPRAKLHTEWHCLNRNFYGGYASPGHPTAALDYLVLISTNRETYRYHVRGNGEVIAHSIRRGTTEADLSIPMLIDDPEEDSDSPL